MSHTSWMVLLAGIIISSTGCINTNHTAVLVHDTPPLLAVEFESAEAAAIFQEKLDKKEDDPGTMASGHDTSLLIFMYNRSHKTVYVNAIHNTLVRQADINGDGFITMKEARELRVSKDSSVGASRH